MNPNLTTIDILQQLIRFDTTNPPGNELPAILWIRELLAANGIDSQIYEPRPQRANLIARLKGQGNAPPLLLQGHVDVVTTEGQDWSHPPFEGVISNGFVWGRGAIDMKGEDAMFIRAFLNAHQQGINLPGDVILLMLADEENTGRFGAKYMVDEHKDLFKDVKYALGEVGGFSMDLAGQRFYPIMVAEKQICWMRLTIKGPGGHGSMSHRGGTMAKLGTILTTIDKKRLPVHITPATRQMISGLAEGSSFPTSMVLRLLLNPLFTDGLLDLLGDNGKLFDPLLHNTVNATIVHGGHKANVIPAEIKLDIDGRLLPGYKPQDLIREFRALIGEDTEIEVMEHDPGPPEPDMGLFPVLADVIKKHDPAAKPIPLILPGVTDARFFAELGIQTYGFTPLKLPTDFPFSILAHAADERVPVDAMGFGTNAIMDVMQRFGEI